MCAVSMSTPVTTGAPETRELLVTHKKQCNVLGVCYLIQVGGKKYAFAFSHNYIGNYIVYLWALGSRHQYGGFEIGIEYVLAFYFSLV